MAYESPGFCYTAKSYGDINQYSGVKITANGVEAASANDVIHGVAQMPAAAAINEPIRIMKVGITFAVAGELIAQGAEVKTGSGGKFLVQDSTNPIVGIALTGAGGDGEEFSLLLL